MRRPLTSFASIGKHCATSAMPGLPGAANTSASDESFQASACSRPPPPMTRILIAALQQILELREAGEEAKLHGAGGAVSVLGDHQFGNLHPVWIGVRFFRMLT